MKIKLIITTILLLIVSRVQSQTKFSIDSTKLTKELLYNDAKQLISHLESKGDTLANKAGAILSNTSGNVWDILVNQQRVKSVAILCSVLFYLGLVYFYKQRVSDIVTRVRSEKDEWSQHEVLFTFVGLVLIIGLGIFNVLHFQTMLTGFLNPKYGALVDLFNTGTTLLK